MASKPTPQGGDRLSGQQKAAVLLMSLGSEAASRITQHLQQPELETISLEIARLEHVPGELVRSVMEEWQQSNLAAVSLAEGGVEYAREILEQTLGGDQAEAVIRRIQNQLNDSPGFYNLRSADPHQIISFLRMEHPQVMALILSQLEQSQVASILKELPVELSTDVLFRIATLDKVQPEAMRIVEQSLGRETNLSLKQNVSVAGGCDFVASVLNEVNPSLERELLSGVSELDSELSEEIKNLMFVFEDMIGLDDKALQRLVRDLDTKELALALKGASDELKSRIMGVMSERAVGVLKEEMEFLGPVRISEVEAAQGRIVSTVRSLEEAGDITIGGKNEAVIE